MRMLLLSGAALLALSAPAAAAPITFSFTGGFQSFTAPATGLYNILAFGAQGGAAAAAPQATWAPRSAAISPLYPAHYVLTGRAHS